MYTEVDRNVINLEITIVTVILRLGIIGIMISRDNDNHTLSCTSVIRNVLIDIDFS